MRGLRPDFRTNASQKQLIQALRYLDQALRWSPSEPIALSLLGRLIGLEGETWALESERIESLLALADRPWLVQWIAGGQAWHRKTGPQGNPHWEIATELREDTGPLVARVIQAACDDKTIPYETGLQWLKR